MQDVYVENVYGEEVYIIIQGFYTAADGWVAPEDGGASKFTSEDVLTISVEVKFIPMMSSVWGGMWMMMVGIVIRMVAHPIPGPARKGLTPQSPSIPS